VDISKNIPSLQVHPVPKRPQVAELEMILSICLFVGMTESKTQRILSDIISESEYDISGTGKGSIQQFGKQVMKVIEDNMTSITNKKELEKLLTHDTRSIFGFGDIDTKLRIVRETKAQLKAKIAKVQAQ
jgi:hypothetical protein